MNFNLSSYDLTANTPRRINVAGRQVMIVEAAGDITLYAIRNNSRQGEIVGAPQGIAIKAAVGAEGFHGIEVESDQTETLKIAIADDEVDLTAVASSVTITSPLGPNAAVEVEDSGGNNFGDVLSRLSNDRALRSPLTTMAGATMVGRQYTTGGTTTVISAAGNTNGVIIRVASADSDGTADARVRIDSENLIAAPASGGTIVVKDIFVPAGIKIQCGTGGSGAAARVWYEAL